MSKVLRSGNDVTLVTYGTEINNVMAAAELLEQKGISAEVIKLGVIKPIDITAISESVKKTGRGAVIEECIRAGAVGEAVIAALNEGGIVAKAMLLNLGDEFIPHGSIGELLAACGLDSESIAEKVSEMMKGV